MLRILGRANSFNVRKVLWICDELNIPFTREDWGRGFRPTTDEEFLHINPIGLVPAAIDDGEVLREFEHDRQVSRHQARHRCDLSRGPAASRARRAVDGLGQL